MAVIDPYRTLGLSPGASLDEIKAAYRRLAKRYHPDSAGPGAAPRFVQITDAYEMLTSGRSPYPIASRSRSARPTPPPRPASRPRPRPQPDGEPRTERSRGERPSDSRPPGSRPPGSRPPGTRPPGARPAGDRPRSGRRKATMGSTSYDGATQGPLDPGWEGASWYGTDSGTYWTLNPREYADPRKHGPEYQERARRAAADEHGPADDPAPRGEAAAWDPPPRWEYARRPEPSSVPQPGEGPPYPGLVAAALAVGGLALGIVILLTLFARP